MTSYFHHRRYFFRCKKFCSNYVEVGAKCSKQSILNRGEEVLNGLGKRNSLNIKWDRMKSKRPSRMRFYFNDNIKY